EWKSQVDDAEATISLVLSKLNEMIKYLKTEETATISFQGQEVSKAGELEAIQRILPDYEIAKKRIHFLSDILKVEAYQEEYAKLTASTDFIKVRGIADLNSRASVVGHVISKLEYGYSIYKSIERNMEQEGKEYFYPEKIQRDNFSMQIDSALSLLEENLVLFRYLNEEINVGQKMEESTAAKKAFVSCTSDRPDSNKRCISQARSYYNRIQQLVEAIEHMENYIHTNTRFL